MCVCVLAYAAKDISLIHVVTVAHFNVAGNTLRHTGEGCLSCGQLERKRPRKNTP